MPPRETGIKIRRLVSRRQRPCYASSLPPYAPTVLGRSLFVSQAVGQAASLAYSAPLLGTATPCLYLAAIPPHLCRGKPRQKCSGRPGCGRPGRWRSVCQSARCWPPAIAQCPHKASPRAASHTLRGCARISVVAVYQYSKVSARSRSPWYPASPPSRAHTFGPFRPGPGRSSAHRTHVGLCRRPGA